MTGAKFSKNEIRKMVLAKRDAMSADERRDLSTALVDQIDALALEPGQIVSGFLPIRSEIDLRPLMEMLEEKSFTLCVPVTLDRQTIEFRQYTKATPLVDAGFGTIGPDETAKILKPDVMLMPLAAFDENGQRIGYGAGHYDRAIARLHAEGRQPRLIGTAFDCQRVDAIVAEAHDVRLHMAITGTTIHYFELGA